MSSRGAGRLFMKWHDLQHDLHLQQLSKLANEAALAAKARRVSEHFLKGKEHSEEEKKLAMAAARAAIAHGLGGDGNVDGFGNGDVNGVSVPPPPAPEVERPPTPPLSEDLADAQLYYLNKMTKSAIKKAQPRPLTDWELEKVCKWWTQESGEDLAIARRWAAVLTVMYYACWGPAQFTKPAEGDGWEEWLVKQSEVRKEEEMVSWMLRDQKSGIKVKQAYDLEGPAAAVVRAVSTLLVDGAGPDSFLCWLSDPCTPISYDELLDRWGRGVKGARLAPGVETPYAARRGGATFWFKHGLSAKEVAKENGWPSALSVRRFILPKFWIRK